jgi:hypothetical protein
VILAAACALMALVISGCAIYAALTLGHQAGPGCLRRTAAHHVTATALTLAVPAAWAAGHLRFWARAARYHRTRHRYARRMHGPLPAREQGIPYDRRRWLAVLDAWEAPAARPERSRT